MPVRDAFVHIHVVDEAGDHRNPGPNDSVALTMVSPSGPLPLKQPYSEADGYVYKLTTADVVLVVKWAGFAELNQWFSVEAPAERPKLTPYWPGTDKNPSAASKRLDYLLECIKIVRAAGGSDADRSPSVFHVTVTIHVMREYVAVIGADYWEGAVSGQPDAHKSSLDFLGYSITYAAHLYESGLLKPSSQFTLLSSQLGTKEVWARATAKGWRRQRVKTLKLPAPSWPTAKDFVDWHNGMKDGALRAMSYLGGPDVYRYLSDVGQYRPGTIADFSIFSHAWAGGPILFNTYYDETLAERTANDLDMRYEYDFVDPATRGWPNIPASFASNGRAVIWGCYATELFRNMVNYLRRTTPSTTEAFQDVELTNALGVDRAPRSDVVAYLRNTVMNDANYMKRLAHHITRDVYGGPPGYGSEWIDYANVTMIPAAYKKVVKGKILHIPTTINAKSSVRREYESEELGARKFNGLGYMKYEP